MKHRCDTWKDCGDSTCRHAKSHGECWRSRGPTKCSTADCLVRCNPISLEEDVEYLHDTGICENPDCPDKVHSCYYCNHEGPCVSRIHSTEFTAWGRTQEIRYVCDDGDACDERFQSNTVDLEGAVRDIIRDVVLDVTRETAGPLYIRDEATARIMKLIELPF